MYTKFRDAVGAMPWLLLAMSHLTWAACECGYSVNQTSDESYAVFTDLFESDFLHTVTDNLTEAGWQPQVWKINAEEARGTYGKAVAVENVELNPLKNKFSWAGEAENGGDAGLRMWVRGDHSKGFVSGSEVVTMREDQIYGSYRIGVKLAEGDTGSCGAFFWFHNNSREIDMEFLSNEFNNSQGGINLVIHTPDSVAKGFDASNTRQFRKGRLPFRPDDKFHEYRFDWTEGNVSFYVDGEWLYDMTNMIPNEGGRMFMNHWSNGDPKWSGGPPREDVAMTISYVKAYFNSTDDSRKKEYSERCANWNASAVCPIPAQTVAPDPAGPEGNKTARTYFFSQDEDHAPDQEIFHTNNNPHSAAIRSFSTAWYAYAPLFVALFGWTLAI